MTKAYTTHSLSLSLTTHTHAESKQSTGVVTRKCSRGYSSFILHLSVEQNETNEEWKKERKTRARGMKCEKAPLLCCITTHNGTVEGHVRETDDLKYRLLSFSPCSKAKRPVFSGSIMSKSSFHAFFGSFFLPLCVNPFIEYPGLVVPVRQTLYFLTAHTWSPCEEYKRLLFSLFLSPPSWKHDKVFL